MIKPYSPNGTYLPEHRKKRIWKKHWNAERRAKFPKAYKGNKVYFYGYTNGCPTFTARPKREGLFAISLYSALDIRSIY